MRPSCCAIPGAFTLRRIGKLVALAASEDAPAIDHRNPLAAPTGRAEEPVPFAAHVTRRGRQVDGVAFILPFIATASVSIGQDHAPQLCPDVDRSDDLAVPRPLPTEGASWRKEAATFPAPHINRPIALCRVLGPAMPSPPASTSAHDPQVARRRTATSIAAQASGQRAQASIPPATARGLRPPVCRPSRQVIAMAALATSA